MRLATDPQIDEVIYWVRSQGNGGKDRVPAYFKGRWPRSCPDGSRGDIKARPAGLGPGEFTVTYGSDDCETEDGRSLGMR